MSTTHSKGLTGDKQNIMIEGFVVTNYSEYSKEYQYELTTYSLNTEGYQTVHQFSVMFPVPDINALNTGTIAALRAKATEIKAEAQKKVVEIEEAIQSLLAIESK